jgi:shikimate dehydrogenase
MFWRLGVIGSPIEHSLSPTLHRAALRELGLDGASTAIEIGRDDVSALSRALDSHDALSVTMPLKEIALLRCDEVDEVAARVGAVNTLRITDGRVLGRSTDGAGFLDAVHALFDLDVAGREVAVRGSGGSARSIIDALDAAGAIVNVLARDEEAADRLASKYRNVVANPAHTGELALIVNTVPAGQSDDGPIDRPIGGFTTDAAAMDIVYEPRESPWLAARRTRGLRVANGLAMLAYQARHQFRWWFGADVSAATLLEAIA